MALEPKTTHLHTHTHTWLEWNAIEQILCNYEMWTKHYSVWRELGNIRLIRLLFLLFMRKCLQWFWCRRHSCPWYAFFHWHRCSFLSQLYIKCVKGTVVCQIGFDWIGQKSVCLRLVWSKWFVCVMCDMWSIRVVELFEPHQKMERDKFASWVCRSLHQLFDCSIPK